MTTKTQWEDLHARGYEPERVRILLAQIASTAMNARPGYRYAGVNAILEALFGPEPDVQNLRDEQVAAIDEAQEYLA